MKNSCKICRWENTGRCPLTKAPGRQMKECKVYRPRETTTNTTNEVK